MKAPRYRLTLPDLSADDLASLVMLCDGLDPPDLPIGLQRRLQRRCAPLLQRHDAWRRRTFRCAQPGGRLMRRAR